MKKYDIFLFDADDTLYDFNLSSAYALKAMFEQCGFVYSDSVQARYNQINRQALKRYEKGEFTLYELQTVRFSRLFGEVGVSYDTEEFYKGYIHELGKGVFLLDGALEICREIASHGKRIYIVTNGPPATQEARAKYSPLSKYITGVFDFHTIGHQKPNMEFFQHVFAHIPADKDKMLIIGDSLPADVGGGNNAGIDTCWLNARNAKNRTAIKPVYVVKRLLELRKFI